MTLGKSVGKKDNLNYVQVRGHVPKAVARQFKQFCLDEEIDFSEGLEKILTTFFTTYVRRLNSDVDYKNGREHENLASAGNNQAHQSLDGYEMKTAQLR